MKKSEIPKAYLYRQVVQAKRYIEDNYHQEVNLGLISKEAAFSKFHFLRLFKESFGLTPNQFLIEVRLGHAKKLLLQDCTIQDACWQVGFESVSSFTMLFKKKFGLPPAKFVREQKIYQENTAKNPLKFIPGCFASSFDWEE